MKIRYFIYLTFLETARGRKAGKNTRHDRIGIKYMPRKQSEHFGEEPSKVSHIDCWGEDQDIPDPPDRRQPPKENSQRKVISISFHFYLPPVLACCFESHFRVTPQSCSILHSGSPWNSSLSPRLLICQHPLVRVLNLRAPFGRIVVLAPEVQLFVLLSRVP